MLGYDSDHGQANRELSMDEDDEVSYDNYVENTIDPGNTLFVIAVIISILSFVSVPLVARLGRHIVVKYGKPDESSSGGHDFEIHHVEQIERVGNLVASPVVEHEQTRTDAPESLSNSQHSRKVIHPDVPSMEGLKTADEVGASVRFNRIEARGHYEHDNRDGGVGKMSPLRDGSKKTIQHIEQVGDLVASPVVEYEQTRTDAPESLSDSKHSRESINPDVPSTERLETAEEVGASVRFDQVEARGHYEYDNRGVCVGKESPLRDGTEIMGDRPLGASPERIGISLTQAKTFFPVHLNEVFCYCWTVMKYDREMKRILRLSIPFTISAISKTASELIIVAIISHTLGTNAMVAYAMTFGLVGITFSFMGGWHDAVSTLVSMAYGAENHELAGKYLQVACISFVLCEIPMAFIWIASMEKILLLMGFDDSIAMLGQDFVWIRVLINTMTGVNLCILNFLAAIEHDKFSNTIVTSDAIAKAGFVALAAFQLEASLVVLGLVLFVNAALVFALLVLIPIKMEWVQTFEIGLFSSCSREDMPVLKDVFRVALPLAFGALMAYAEWEILTIFAVSLGPAEVATWAVMGFVWDLFESTTEAAGDASEIRVSYHLGKGRPSKAKLAGFKSMLFGAILSILVSVIFISMTDVLPSMLTRDATIQYMLAELFPLVAFGNITMSMGMVCWCIVGAQGRYHLSTLIALACSFMVTIPIGAIVTIGLRIDLQGLAFAVVTGYTITATVLFACIIISDWEMLSKAIQDQVCAGDLSDDSSDDDGSTSSSSSKEGEDPNPQTPEDFRQHHLSLQ
jgi:Na+-driven multidrug efflux pump